MVQKTVQRTCVLWASASSLSTSLRWLLFSLCQPRCADLYSFIRLETQGGRLYKLEVIYGVRRRALCLQYRDPVPWNLMIIKVYIRPFLMISRLMISRLMISRLIWYLGWWYLGWWYLGYIWAMSDFRIRCILFVYGKLITIIIHFSGAGPVPSKDAEWRTRIVTKERPV